MSLFEFSFYVDGNLYTYISAPVLIPINAIEWRRDDASINDRHISRELDLHRAGRKHWASLDQRLQQQAEGKISQSFIEHQRCRFDTVLQNSCAESPRPAAILARDFLRSFCSRGERARTKLSTSSSSTGETRTATALPFRVMTTGPSVRDSLMYALNRALTSASGAILVI